MQKILLIKCDYTDDKNRKKIFKVLKENVKICVGQSVVLSAVRIAYRPIPLKIDKRDGHNDETNCLGVNYFFLGGGQLKFDR